MTELETTAAEIRALFWQMQAKAEVLIDGGYAVTLFMRMSSQGWT